MAWQLVEEVFRHAPSSITAGQRLLLLAIANQVRQDDVRARTCVVRVQELADMTGMTKESVTSAATRLRDVHQLEVRVPLKDSGGRLGSRSGRSTPLYAVAGVLPTFRVPEFEPPAGCQCSACQPKVSRGSATADPPIGGSALDAGGSATDAGGSATDAGGSATADPFRGTGVPGIRDAPARSASPPANGVVWRGEEQLTRDVVAFLDADSWSLERARAALAAHREHSTMRDPDALPAKRVRDGKDAIRTGDDVARDRLRRELTDVLATAERSARRVEAPATQRLDLEEFMRHPEGQPPASAETRAAVMASVSRGRPSVPAGSPGSGGIHAP